MDTTTPTSSFPTTSRSRRRLARLAVLLMVVGLLGTVLVTVREALAADSTPGVKYVDFDPKPTVCFGVPGVHCLPDAGSGKSNTIYVRQNEVDGQLRFNEVFGTGENGDVWFQTTVSGACASNHRLRSLEIHGGHVGDGGALFAESEGPHAEGFPISLPVDHDHKTIPTRNLAIHRPVDQVLDELAMSAPLDIEAWGEQRIADLVADGESEQNARVAPYRYTINVGMHAQLHCRRRTNHDLTPNAWDSVYHPVEVVWLGAGMEPGEEDSDGWRDALIPDTPEAPPPIDPNFSVGFQVTQATLAAVEDDRDPCRLHLSGSVTTTEPGVVTYRFVDDLDQRSQTFRVEVDQTLTAFFDNVVELDPIVLDPPASDGPPDALASEGSGEIGGLTQEEGHTLRGYYRLEVVTPHVKASETASYLIDGCVVVDRDDATLTTPTAPPEPPTDLSASPSTVPPIPVPPPGDLTNPD